MTLAEYDRANLEDELVEQSMLHERLDEDTASEDHQRLIVCSFQARDRFGGLSFKENAPTEAAPRAFGRRRIC